MYIHPETGRLLARARNEEAQSRLRLVAALRAASLDTQTRPLSVGARVRRYRREGPMAASPRRPRARRARLRANAPSR